MVYPIVKLRKRLQTGLVFVTFILLSCLSTISPAQDTEQEDTKLQEKAIKVFLDISGFYNEHIKREIPFVNYVRDRKQAMVYIMMTTERTGSGGTEHTMFFIGQKELTGQNDTLKYVSKQSDTEEIIHA